MARNAAFARVLVVTMLIGMFGSVIEAQLLSEEEAAALPVGQHQLPDGSEVLKLESGKVFYLVLPPEFHADQRPETAPLSGYELREAGALGVGVHKLSTGREVVVLGSGNIAAVPTAEETARAQASANLDMKPGYRETQAMLSDLRECSAQALLDSLGEDPGLRAIHHLATEPSWTPYTLPLHPAHGFNELKEIIVDRRLDLALEKFGALDSEEASRLVAASIHRYLPLYRAKFSSLMECISQGPARSSDAQDSRYMEEFWRCVRQTVQGISDATAQQPRYALLFLVFTAAQLELKELHPLVRELCRIAVSDMDAIYAQVAHPEAATFCANLFSIYNRQILAAALLATAPASDDDTLQEFAYMMERQPLRRYDADPYTPQAASTSGESRREVRFVRLVSDDIFRRLLARE